jgi:hypothetical protein
MLAVLVASSFVILGSSDIPQAHAAQPIPASEYFGNTYNSTQASLGTVAISNTTQLIDMRFTARYDGDAVPRVSIYADYFNTSAKYDVAIGIQTDVAGQPSGNFLGAFVWNVTSGLCDGCGGWVYPGFARQSYNLNHTITLVAGAVYNLVVKYLNGSFVNTGGCYGTDCLVVQYIGGTNFRQESLDMHYDPNQALLACGNIGSCDVVPGANAVYALDINGSAWWQGQTESLVLDRPIGAAKGGNGLDSFQGERFWMAWNSVTVKHLQVHLSRTGAPTGRLNLLVWNFSAPSAADILRTSDPQLMLNQTLIGNLETMSSVGDKSYNFSLSTSLTLEYGHMYQISFAIYGNTTTINGANELGVEVTNSNYNSNPLNWDGGASSAGASCQQYALSCAGFRYTGSTDNSASEEWGYEDLVFIMKIEYSGVMQPISVQMSDSAPPQSVSINGCHASPLPFPADGVSHLESVDPSCAFSLSFNNSGSARAGFRVAGGFSATSSSQTSCPSGACPVLSLKAFEQVENTFRATPITPSEWDAGLKIPVTGTELGSQGVEGCAISTSSGGGRAACQAWFDFGTIATISSPVAISSSERWSTPDQNAFRQATGGNNYTAGYVDQFSVSFSATPAGAGIVHPSNSSLWENYGQILVNAAAAQGFGFVSWATNAAGITLLAQDNSSTTVTVHGAGTIAATFVALVTQPISLSVAEQGAQAATFSLSGCSVSPTSLFGNGTSLSFRALPSCSMVVTSPVDSKSLRYRFDAGGQPSPTFSLTTCSKADCPGVASTYYEQVSEEFAYAIEGGGSGSPPSLNFTSLGIRTNETESTAPTTAWLDFGTPWSMNGILPGSSQTERWAASSGVSGTANVSRSATVAYQHQYSIDVVASLAGCGATIPAGASWEPAGVVFLIETSSSKNCAFNVWNATQGILIAQPSLLNSTVSAYGPGVITASFAVPLAKSSTVNTSVLYAGVLVCPVVVVIVLIIRVARRRSARSRGEPLSKKPTIGILRRRLSETGDGESRPQELDLLFGPGQEAD